MLVAVTRNVFDAFIHSRKEIYQVVHNKVENTDIEVDFYVAVDDNSIIATVTNDGTSIVRKISLTDSDSIDKMEIEMLDKVDGLILPYLFHIETYMVNPEKKFNTLLSLIEKHKDRYALISIIGTRLHAIIKKDSLCNKYLIVYARSNELGYIIGKKGINIAMTIETINEEFSYSKVERITVKAANKDLSPIRKEFLGFIEDL